MARTISRSRAATRGLAAITLMIGSLTLAGCGGDVEAALAELTIGGAQDARHEQSKDVARRVRVGARTQLDFSFPMPEKLGGLRGMLLGMERRRDGKRQAEKEFRESPACADEPGHFFVSGDSP